MVLFYQNALVNKKSSHYYNKGHLLNDLFSRATHWTTYVVPSKLQFSLKYCKCLNFSYKTNECLALLITPKCDVKGWFNTNGTRKIQISLVSMEQ